MNVQLCNYYIWYIYMNKTSIFDFYKSWLKKLENKVIELSNMNTSLMEENDRFKKFLVFLKTNNPV